MSPGSGRLLIGLGAIAAALAVCMAVPAVDPQCRTGSDAAAMLGACRVAQAGLFQDLMLLGYSTGAAILTIVAASIARQAVLHHHVSNALWRSSRPIVVAEHSVGLISGGGTALVAGIRRPQTYCSDDVLTRLDADELRAVMLHERYHELSKAPARLVILSALEPLVGVAAPGSAWLARERARIEIEADEHALANGATRPALARAILKLADVAPTLTLAGFSSASDLRLRALLGDVAAPTGSPRQLLPTAIGAAVAIAAICGALPVL